MEKFFEQFPVKLSEKIAVKMMTQQAELACEKSDAKDEQYIHDLLKLYKMLCVYFEELGINPDDM